MLYALLLAGAVLCAVQAIRATRLLSAAIWLAGVSALVAITLYKIGAREVAVIELSVGAGLVTVLFVFAISIAGNDGLAEQKLLPKPLALGLIALFLAILGAMVLPMDKLGASAIESSFSDMLWDDRALDVLVQIVIIFAGVLCVLGLLTDVKVPVGFAGERDSAQPPDSLAGKPDEAASQEGQV
ncbi:MAG: hypothetical protein JXJ20_04475 [Anaerolineae bacterium]|nr:hypothetical protein [Anaerolineae bacterium]